MICFLHHRYRERGGEDRAVDDLARIVRERLGEPVTLLERGTTPVSRARAARGLLAGGLHPDEVERAVRDHGARIVHAHNLHPTYGWRALAAARRAGARTVLHLHNYRLVCAVGTCVDPEGEPCLRCHGRDTRPGVRHGCRGSRAEALVYAAALSRTLAPALAHADAIAVPSPYAAERLRRLGVPLDGLPVHVVPGVVWAFAPGSAAARGTYAVTACRLAPEKGVEVAIEAARRTGMALRVAGDGPRRAALQAAAAGAPVTFTGRLDDGALAALRAGAALEVVPTRAPETFGLAALEAMAAGVPVVAARSGALADVLPEEALVPAGDAAALAAAWRARYADAGAGAQGITVARAHAAPERAAAALAALYDALP